MKTCTIAESILCHETDDSFVSKYSIGSTYSSIAQSKFINVVPSYTPWNQSQSTIGILWTNLYCPSGSPHLFSTLPKDIDIRRQMAKSTIKNKNKWPFQYSKVRDGRSPVGNHEKTTIYPWGYYRPQAKTRIDRNKCTYTRNNHRPDSNTARWTRRGTVLAL